MNLNIRAKQDHTYDAIVVGTEISGGWSEKELTEKGLNTLVLEHGRDVKHVGDYPITLLFTTDGENKLGSSAMGISLSCNG